MGDSLIYHLPPNKNFGTRILQALALSFRNSRQTTRTQPTRHLELLPAERLSEGPTVPSPSGFS